MSPDIDVDTVAADVFAGWDRNRVPPTFRAFAASMVLPRGESAGERYDPDSDPTQRYLIDQMDSGLWRRIYWVAAPQVGGKTQVAVTLPIMRTAIACRLPVGYGLPTLQAVDKAYRSKLKESLEKSGYGDHLPVKGPGARGGRPPVLPFRDPETGDDEGEVVFMAGGAFGDTVACMIVDEVDQLRNAKGKPRWGDFEDMMRRPDAYRTIGIRIATGTVEADEESIILVLVDEHGTGTRMHARCPHCRQHQRLSFAHVVYDGSTLDAARSTARFRCEHCQADWSEQDRVRALHDALFVHRGQRIEGGQVVGDVPATGGVLGIHSTAYDSPRTDLGAIVVEYLQAVDAIERRASHELMRKFVRYRDCECYLGDRQEEETSAAIEPAWLAKRFDQHGPGPVMRDTDEGQLHSRYVLAEVPRDLDGAVLACDVQQDRVYWTLTGYEAESWREVDLGWGYEVARQPIEPWGDGELALVMRRIDAQVPGYVEDTAGVPVRFRVVDTNFDTDELEKILRAMPHWRAVVGAERLSKSIPKSRRYREGLIGFEPRWRPRLGRFEVITTAARAEVHDAYLRTPGDPLSAVLPTGLRANDHYLRHICAWRREWKKGKLVWVAHQKRDDWLDCRSYGHALIVYAQTLAARQQEQAQKPKRPPTPGNIMGG